MICLTGFNFSRILAQESLVVFSARRMIARAVKTIKIWASIFSLAVWKIGLALRSDLLILKDFSTCQSWEYFSITSLSVKELLLVIWPFKPSRSFAFSIRLSFKEKSPSFVFWRNLKLLPTVDGVSKAKRAFLNCFSRSERSLTA